MFFENLSCLSSRVEQAVYNVHLEVPEVLCYVMACMFYETQNAMNVLCMYSHSINWSLILVIR